jgi:hypothetical protein
MLEYSQIKNSKKEGKMKGGDKKKARGSKIRSNQGFRMNTGKKRNNCKLELLQLIANR